VLHPGVEAVFDFGAPGVRFSGHANRPDHA
jgi:hypothetical protein